MPHTPRTRIKTLIAGDKPSTAPAQVYSPADVYGRDAFTMQTMRERLPKNVYLRVERIFEQGEALKESDADMVASAMRDWAIERGATHYTHWFQPMTGTTAEKHDAFLTPVPGSRFEVRLINEFSGKMLVKGEPDASSFPSGGIRSTFEARGYTAWDPSSPVFLLENSLGRTLYVPSIFISYTGESLDYKTPLLRSLEAVSRQALRILRLFGNTKATHVDAMVGSEQEYFLIDRRYLTLRDDLKLAGRTLFGAMSSKGQELEDHYFGSIGRRVLSFMAEVEKRMFSLGIPARTRHNEVAPAQFELAPMYERANIATDHNMLTMEILRSTAEMHGMVCLLHEKPFAGINGSGKHNNWSLCDSEGNNLLDPGSTPLDNAQFLVFLAAVLRAVHKHPIVLRLGTTGAGNDHRLGANEAPPAILSIFLGDQLCSIIDSITEGKNNGKGDSSGWVTGDIKVGVSTLPPLPRDVSDRNRTSPFAFTGNKFEFRAVGSSTSIAPANIALNTAISCAMDDIATELEFALSKGTPLSKAVQSLLAKLFKEHRPIIFNGNGYSGEWTKEAARRGLPNLKDSVSVLLRHSDKEVMDAFLRQKVLTERELLARQEVLLENYIRDVHVETKLVADMGRSAILPVAMRWMREAGETALASRELLGESGGKEELPEEKYFKRVREQVLGLMEALDALDEKHKEVDNLEGITVRSEAARDVLLPLMAKCREHADALEKLVDDVMWPLPKYNEMLWQL
jgi:glutamine synthetase